MPFQVVPATGPVLEQVLTDTFPLWSDGLSRENYAKAWAAQLKTPWGQQHLDRVALVDGPHVLSSAKRYDLSLRIDGRIRRVLGIGAVFTAAAHRGRGCARELLTRMLDTAVTEGQEFAMLFSEIAPAFYEQLDFVPVPLIESTLEVDQKRGGAPAMLVRSGDEKDLPSIVEMSAARSTDARLALDRSEDLIRFMITRKRIHSGLGAVGLSQHGIPGRRRRAPGRRLSGEHRAGRALDDRGGRRSRSVGRAARRDAAGDAGAPSRASACPRSSAGGRRRWCRRRSRSRPRRRRRK